MVHLVDRVLADPEHGALLGFGVAVDPCALPLRRVETLEGGGKRVSVRGDRRMGLGRLAADGPH